MLYPEGKRGKKRIADDMMEVIEDAFGLQRGWLDGENAAPAHGALARNVRPMVVQEDPRIVAVVAMMLATDGTGREVALGAVLVALSGYKVQSIPAGKRCPVISIADFRQNRIC